MDPDDDVRALLSQVPDGPPLRLDAAGVIARGAAVRRRRKRWAVAASSAATAAVLVVAGLAVGNHGGTPAPVEPAKPGLATVPSSPPRSPASQRPGTAEPSDRPATSPSRDRRSGSSSPPRASRTMAPAPPYEPPLTRQRPSSTPDGPRPTAEPG
ncbi:hypothetical protein [Amycolatopsis jiangsuensis]|uniref:Uncharacterized protein n=1 Tax=Amycolatopsis jiangsuensis TaxID=1181879 RepID=A0A840IZW9_9PSEU|nr:hypothetical protein [Amycolatopsis jiangsuensis]MBB4686708.1 hypothetical protein [Amycolatopsis jiangsuensis]